MPRIKRVRFVNVGLPKARVDDLTLDWSDGQRAAHTVNWLENGGGKTTLLSLIFATLLPARDDFLLRDRGLTLNTLLPGDSTAQVVLEVELPGGNALIGAFYQTSKGSENLSRLHFLARVGPALALDTLPLIEEREGGRRRVPLAAFHSHLRTLRAQGEAVEFDDRVGEWEKILMGFGIFSQLVRFQMLMSRREGDVENGLKFRNDRELIDLLTQVLLPPDAMHEFTGSLRELRDGLREYQARHAPRALFAERVLPALETFAARGDVLEERERELQEALSRAQGVWRQVRDRAEDLAAQHERLLAGSRQQEREAAEAGRARDAATLRARQVQFALHRAELDCLNGEEAVAQGTLTELEAERRVARLLDRLAEWRRAEVERDELTRLHARLKRDLGPTADELDAAGRALAAALLWRAGQLEAEAGRMRGEVEAQEASLPGLRAEDERARRDLVALELRQHEVAEQLDRARLALAALVEADVLREGEPGATGLERLRGEGTLLQAQVTDLDSQLADLDGQLAALDHEEDGEERHRRELERERDDVARSLREAGKERDALTGNFLLHAYGGGAEPDQGLLRTLDARVQDTERSVLSLAAQEAGHELTAQEVRATGLLPAAGDVQQVLATLAIRGAVTGYAAHRKLGAGRPVTPELARLVVIGEEDRPRLEAALAAYPDKARPFEGVRIVTSGEFGRLGDLPGVVLDPASAGHVDEAAARAFGQRTHAKLERVRERLHAERATQAELADLRARLALYLERFPQDVWAMWQTRLAALERDLAQVDERQAQLAGRRTLLTTRRTDTVRARQEAEVQVRHTERAVVEVRSTLGLADLPALEAELAGLPERAAWAEDEAEAARGQLQAAQERLTALQGRMGGLLSAAGTERAQADRVLLGAPRPEPREGPLDELRARVGALTALLEGADLARVTRDLERADEAVRQKDLAFARKSGGAVSRAEVEGYEARHPSTDPDTLLDDVEARLEAQRRRVAEVREQVATQRERMKNFRAQHGAQVEAGDLTADERHEAHVAGLLDLAREHAARAELAAERQRETLRHAEEVGAVLENYRKAAEQLDALPAAAEPISPLPVEDAQVLGATQGALREWRGRQDARGTADEELRTAFQDWTTAHTKAGSSALGDNTVVRLREADLHTLGRAVRRALDDLRTLVELAAREQAALEDTGRQWARIALRQVRDFEHAVRDLAAHSLVPQGVKTLGGKAFLTVRSQARGGEAHLEERALQLTLSFAGGEADLKPETVLRRFVHELYAFEVRMLYPNNGYHTVEYKTVEDMQASNSGGEGVAATLLLYCAIAKARHRRGNRLFAGGDALLLDNPFAKMTAAHLLQPVLEAATASGVQLVTFTGVESVVGQFTRIVRLRKGHWDRGRQEYLLSANHTLSAVSVVQK